jgi:hypothetical protein
MTENDVRDWQLERHLLGELPSVDRETLARALLDEASLARRARDLEESNREILAAHPPRVAAAIICERLRLEWPPVWRRSLVALATSVAVLLVGSALWHGPQDPLDTNRIKGLRPSLLVFRHTPVGDEVLPDRALARAGDVVQLTYQAAGQRYGVIVSLDGRGVVTVHHPQQGSRAARLSAGKPVRLASAYRLDDAPGWERFILVTSNEGFDVATVVEAARLTGTEPGAAFLRLTLPEGLDQSSFTLTKEDPR